MAAAVTTLTGLMSDVLGMITENTTLMVFFVAPIVGTVLGYAKRLRG